MAPVVEQQVPVAVKLTLHTFHILENCLVSAFTLCLSSFAWKFGQQQLNCTITTTTAAQPSSEWRRWRQQLFYTLHIASLLPLVTRLPVQGVGLPKCDRMQSICNISFSLFSLTLSALLQLTAAKAQQMWQLLLHEHALIAQVQRANKTEHNYERIA